MGEIIPSETRKQIGHQADLTNGNKLSEIFCVGEARNKTVETSNAVIATHLALVLADKPDILCLEECVQAVSNYFQRVKEYSTKPTISGIAMALGITRSAFVRACDTGCLVNSVTKDSIVLPRDVFEFLVNLKENYIGMLEGYMEEGMIHPASGIFLLKNNSDYKDVVEKHYSVTQTTVDVAALAEKYKLESELE